MGIKCVSFHDLSVNIAYFFIDFFISFYFLFKSLRHISTHTYDWWGKPKHTQENCSEMSHFVDVAFLFQSTMSNLDGIEKKLLHFGLWVQALDWGENIIFFSFRPNLRLTLENYGNKKCVLFIEIIILNLKN